MAHLTGTRYAALAGEMLAERANEHAAGNPKPFAAGMEAYYLLGKQRAAEELSWGEIKALINKSSPAALAAFVGTPMGVGTELWADTWQVSSYINGVREIHDAVMATARRSF